MIKHTIKCKYYNDHRSCCVLFLDDLSLTATTIDGQLIPCNDWGYGLFERQSLFSYLYNTIFMRYPEIRGTIFLPLLDHAIQNKSSGYHIHRRKPGPGVKDFIHILSDRFEIAFHGLNHGKYLRPEDPGLNNNWKNEFEYFTPADIPFLKEAILSIEDMYGISIDGGKCPGYVQNENALDIVEALGFDYWLSSAAMMNKRDKFNFPYIMGKEKKIVHIPTNLSGDIFNERVLALSKYRLSFLKYLKSQYSIYKNKLYLSYLYQDQVPITIQEHCQNMRTDGKRQTYNIFDDSGPLEMIYECLRGHDIWYTTCRDLADYFKAYSNSEIIDERDGFQIKPVNDKGYDLFISIRSDRREILNKKENKSTHGLYKNGYWVYNKLGPGQYKYL